MKKPRSPGRKSFRSDPMGTPEDWAQVAHSPHVQRMLQDPQLSQALYQNFRQTGGNVPPPPAGMAQGGALDLDEADYMNEIAQELNDPNATPARKQALRNKLAQLGRAPRISMPEPMERAQGGALRFADGGSTMADLDSEEQEANADLARASAANDTAAASKARERLNRIQQARMKLTAAQASPQTQQSPTQSQPGSVSLGNAGTVSGSTMANMQKLTGPMTAGNETASVLGGALLGGASSGSPAGALIGAATAGLLNFFIRKHNQQQQQNAQKQMQSPANGAQNYAGRSNAVADNPQSSYSGSAGPPAGSSAAADSGDQQFKDQQEANRAGRGADYKPPAQPAAQSTPSGPGLWSGTYSGGNATSSDGTNWTDQKTGKPVTDPVVNQTQIGSFGQPQDQAPAAAADLPAPTPSDLSMYGPEWSLESGLGGMAKGGPVKPPHGLATVVPVLHVMIAAVPKGKKKAMGGDIPQSERRPRRPDAVPPVRGPHNGYLLPHGRVQVPRGSGAAIKGKRFGGIY